MQDTHADPPNRFAAAAAAAVSLASLYPRSLQITVMSFFFVGHIHFYGQSQHLFGDLGPVVAWPLIMSSTVRSQCRSIVGVATSCSPLDR